MSSLKGSLSKSAKSAEEFKDSAGRLILVGDEVTLISKSDKNKNVGKVTGLISASEDRYGCGYRINVELSNGTRTNITEQEIKNYPDRLISETAKERAPALSALPASESKLKGTLFKPREP